MYIMAAYFSQSWADPRMKSPLHWAAEHRVKYPIYEALVKATIRCDPRLLRRADDEGWEPLHALVKLHDGAMRDPQFLDVLVKAGVDLCTTSKKNGDETVLHLAVRRMDKCMVWQLLCHGEKSRRLIEAKARDPRTGQELRPLELACSLHDPHCRLREIERLLRQVIMTYCRILYQNLELFLFQRRLDMTHY